MKIGATLKRLRLERSLTQGEVESRAGISTGNLSRLERDEQNYTGEVLSALSRALDVPVYQFFEQPAADAESTSMAAENGASPSITPSPLAQKIALHISVLPDEKQQALATLLGIKLS